MPVHDIFQAWMASTQPIAGMTYSQSNTAIFAPNMRRNRTQAVVARIAAADFYPYLGRWKFNFVMKHGQAGKRQFVKAHCLLNRATRLVHVSLRLQQHNDFAV